MLLAGCNTTELPKYQAQVFDTYQFSGKNKGLAIALSLFQYEMSLNGGRLSNMK